MEDFLKIILEQFGWSIVGWVIAVFVVIFTFLDGLKNRLTHRDILDRLDVVTKAYHTAVVDNTRVTERLAMLIEERTRQRNGPNGSDS